jgi:hypothetical protein
MLVISRELKMQKYFVYMLCDPRKPDAKYESGFEPFYIGSIRTTKQKFSQYY